MYTRALQIYIMLLYARVCVYRRYSVEEQDVQYIYYIVMVCERDGIKYLYGEGLLTVSGGN